jgi:hypothetical protein
MRAVWLDHGNAHMIFFSGDVTVNWAVTTGAKEKRRHTGG